MGKPFWVENIGEAWRWMCMWVQGTGAALMGAFLVLSEQDRTAIFSIFNLTAEQGVSITALTVFLSGMVARVKKQ